MDRSPGAPLSRYPASVAVRWNASTVALVGAGNAMCSCSVGGRGSGLPERVGVLSRSREEGDVQTPCHGLLLTRLREREVAPLGAVLTAVRLLEPDRRQHRVVKLLRCLSVRGADRYVIEHV